MGEKKRPRDPPNVNDNRQLARRILMCWNSLLKFWHFENTLRCFQSRSIIFRYLLSLSNTVRHFLSRFDAFQYLPSRIFAFQLSVIPLSFSLVLNLSITLSLFPYIRRLHNISPEQQHIQRQKMLLSLRDVSLPAHETPAFLCYPTPQPKILDAAPTW